MVVESLNPVVVQRLLAVGVFAVVLHPWHCCVPWASVLWHLAHALLPVLAPSHGIARVLRWAGADLGVVVRAAIAVTPLVWAGADLEVVVRADIAVTALIWAGADLGVVVRTDIAVTSLVLAGADCMATAPVG